MVEFFGLPPQPAQDFFDSILGRTLAYLLVSVCVCVPARKGSLIVGTTVLCDLVLSCFFNNKTKCLVHFCTLQYLQSMECVSMCIVFGMGKGGVQE